MVINGDEVITPTHLTLSDVFAGSFLSHKEFGSPFILLLLFIRISINDRYANLNVLKSVNRSSDGIKTGIGPVRHYFYVIKCTPVCKKKKPNRFSCDSDFFP